MANTNRNLISDEYQDSDGYWIELKDGWQNGADPGTHCVHEDTKTRAYEVLRMAEPCDCVDCHQRLSQMTKNPAAVALGRLGGSATSPRKAKSSARNGKLGGWPKGKPRKPKGTVVKLAPVSTPLTQE